MMTTAAIPQGDLLRGVKDFNLFEHYAPGGTTGRATVPSTDPAGDPVAGRRGHSRASPPRFLKEVESLEAAATEARSSVRGTLRIDMPVTYGRQVVMPVLIKLMARHLGLNIDARFDDHVVHVIKEGLDAATRSRTVIDSSLVGRQFDEQFVCN